MLEQVLMNIRNWFPVKGGIYSGTFTIKDGGITLPFLATGQYFRIIGSVFNDGLHQYPASDLKAETFEGTVWALAVPQAVIELATEMETWETKNGEAAAGIYQSESFGGYQYSKQTASDGGQVTVWSAFRKRLNQWRKL